MNDRRKTLLVNAIQQRRFIMGAVLTGIILINLTVICAVFFDPQLIDAIDIRHIIFLAGIETITVLSIAYFSLILSHRIAGPAYALARDLKKLAEGDLTVKIHLRKGDFHLEAADALNITANILRDKMKSIKLELAKLETQRNIDEETRKMVEQLLHDLPISRQNPSMIPTDHHLWPIAPSNTSQI